MVIAPRRQQERSELTRSRFLKAAEKIFARDGFEGAKLEEISEEAGYTRGAFYANFEAKEDLFIALLETEVKKRVSEVQAAVSDADEPAAKLKAMRRYFIHASRKRQWPLLFLEFKLFALRHPELKAKVAEMHSRIFATATTALDEIFRSMEIELPVSTLAFATAIGGLAHSLDLDRIIGKAISESEISAVLGLLFDVMTGTA
jgi:AcrR family transcriptional regulator